MLNKAVKDNEQNKNFIQNFNMKITLINHRILKAIGRLQVYQNASLNILQYEDQSILSVNHIIEKLKRALFEKSNLDQLCSDLNRVKDFSKLDSQLSSDAHQDLMQKTQTQLAQLDKIKLIYCQSEKCKKY